MGYTQFISDNIKGFEDIIVVGYGHPKMVRDLYTIVTGGGNITKNMGGKVDLYIKGSSPLEITDTIAVKSNKFYFQETNVIQSSITVANITTPASTPVFTFSAGTPSYITITAGATTEDKLLIDYDYTDSTLSIPKTYHALKYFYFDSFKFVLKNGPFISLISSQNVTSSTDIPTTFFSAPTYPDINYKQSTKESVEMSLNAEPGNIPTTSTPYYTAGDIIEIVYTIDSIIFDAQNLYDKENKRPIVTDVLVKQANIEYVYIAFNVKMKERTSLGNYESSILTNIVRNHINSKGFGAIIKASDLISEILSDDNAKEFVSYIEFPIYLYTNTAKLTSIDAIPNNVHSSVTVDSVKYPQLGMFLPTELV